MEHSSHILLHIRHMPKKYDQFRVLKYPRCYILTNHCFYIASANKVRQGMHMQIYHSRIQMGLLYQDREVPAYEEIRWQRTARPDHETFLQRLDAAMDHYTVS